VRQSKIWLDPEQLPVRQPEQNTHAWQPPHAGSESNQRPAMNLFNGS
jgi:hypothetical protein